MRPRGKGVRMPGHFVRPRCVAERAGPRGDMPRLRPGRFYGRAEPAPPRGGRSEARWPCGGRPGDRAMGGFLGGTRSARPRGKAGRKPGHLMVTDGRAKGWWPKRDNISVGVMSTLRACGARPSAKPGPGQGEPAASKGDASVRRNADITGVRSPPLPGGDLRRDGLVEEGPEIARWAIFSEGRALRVRVARPGASRGISWLRTGERKVGGRKETTFRLA